MSEVTGTNLTGVRKPVKGKHYELSYPNEGNADFHENLATSEGLFFV